MGPVTLAFVVVPVVLFIIMAAAIWGMNKVADVMIGDKHRAIEAITSTGQVPDRWSRRFRRRLERLQRRGDADKLRATQNKAKASYLRRIDKLADYAAASPLVAGEETRQILHQRFTEVRAAWKEKTVDEF